MPDFIKWLESYGLFILFVAALFSLMIFFLIWSGFKAGRLKKPSLWLASLWVFMVYLFASEYTVSIAEHLHIWLYMLLGFLLFGVLRFRLIGARLFFSVATAVAVLGTMDEIIQYYLPNRYFGWNDIVLNILGGITSLIVIRYVLGDQGEKCAA